MLIFPPQSRSQMAAAEGLKSSSVTESLAFVCSLVSQTIPEHREYRIYAVEQKDYRRVSVVILQVICLQFGLRKVRPDERS